MTSVIFDISVSLDEFVTASGVRPEELLGDGGQRLHRWACLREFTTTLLRVVSFEAADGGSNPRYFTVAAGDATDRRAVYLTGSHVNNSFHDGSGPGADCSETPGRNAFRVYLEFLKERLQVAVYRDGELVVDAV